MKNTISLDLWNTVIKGNQEFSTKKTELLLNFFEKELKKEVTVNLVKETWKKLKIDTDKLVEMYGIQPNIYRLWAELLFNLNIEIKDLTKLQQFNTLYQNLFLKYPPNFIDEPSYLLQQGLYISSNTLFTEGKTIKKFLNNNNIILSCKFSDELGVSKPNKQMFWKTTYHIGDNIFTDGNCENFKIKFCNISEKSAKEWVKELKN